MKKYLLSLSAFLLISAVSFAQSNDKPTDALVGTVTVKNNAQKQTNEAVAKPALSEESVVDGIKSTTGSATRNEPKSRLSEAVVEPSSKPIKED